MALSIDKEIDRLRRIPDVGKYLGRALQNLADGINNLGKNVAGDATKTLPGPSTPQSLTVKTNNAGLVHAVIKDHNQIQRGIHYFVEYDTDPAFKQPHVVHLGASRSMNPILLPDTDDDDNPQVWHFRAYAQMPGSEPSAPINFGGDTPTPVNPGGGVKMSLIPSTGSGTAPANGQSAGQGYGKVLHRPATVDIKTSNIG